MGCLGGLLGQGSVMEEARCDRVQGQVELVIPAELEACFGEGVIPLLSIWVTLQLQANLVLFGDQHKQIDTAAFQV